MKLRRLDIRHLPGIERGFSVDFAADTVNVITGPNGSGKSSLVRAVRALLKRHRDDPHIEVAAHWLDGEGELHCERIGQSVQWSRSGRSIQAPRLPMDEAIGAYLISSEDLSALGKTDAHIADALQTLLAGGYDLAAVLSAAPFAAPPRPQKLAREVETLQRAIADKEAEYAALQDELEQLARLESELKRATQAAQMLVTLDDALALADAHASRVALETALIEEFPGGMDRLRGDEMQRLDEARAQLQQKQQALALEQEEMARERTEIEQAASGDPAALETMQAQLAEARDALAGTEQQLSSTEEKIAVARDAVARAASRLGSDLPEQIEQLDQHTLDQLERQVEKVLSQREKIRALSGQLALSQGSRNPSGRPQDDLRSARQSLQDWLALARLNPLEGGLWGSLGLAALLGSLRVLNTENLTANPELLLLAALAIGLPLAMLGRFVLRWRDREQARQRYLGTAIEPPLGWSESEVRTRLERLDTELEAAIQHEVSQARAGELREQLNAQRISLERARDKLKEQAERLGIAAESRLETGFLLWCRHLQDWQREYQQLNEQQMRADSLQQRLQQQTRQAAEILSQHGIEDREISARGMATLIHQLNPRIRRSTALHNSLQARQRRVQELKADLAQIRQQITLLFEGTGIRNDDIATLRQKHEQYPAWQELEQSRRQLAQDIARLEQRLSRHDELLNLAREQHRSQLEGLRQEQVERAEQRDGLNRRIAEIHTRHADVIKRRELERLSAELEQLRERLVQELEAQLLAAAGEHLITEVREAYRQDHEPALLAAADRWLDRFTRHRYRLLFQDGEFFAVDTRSERRLRVAELSTGGRAQFLLAVRLAWIEQQEQQSEPLPVFMDEVLTTSDADRYRAVVAAVRALVDHGRQLFYLTAQNDDAEAWWEWLGEDLKPHAIDMAEVRRGEVEALEFKMPTRDRGAPALPDADGLDAATWAAQVGVEPIDPWQPAGHIHVVYLVGADSKLAHRLVSVGVERLGELERVLAHSELERGRLLDKAEAEALGGRALAARRFLADWRGRHARPVDQAALQASGLLSDRFLPRVAELAAEFNGDATRLLASINQGAVPRFRSDIAEQLGAWLSEHGYLLSESPEPAMTVGELMLDSGLDEGDVRQLLETLRAAIRDPLQATVEEA
ncbi:MAG: hypothetical protein ACXIUM_14070 [Wenzhouxiangella sp.]